MVAINYIEAIQRALWDAMAADERVFCIGEDIGRFGGAFKATRGLIEEYGADRVVDTPISESLIVGASIGAAIRGRRPVAEMQFADFVSCGFSQLVNNAATFHYRLGVRVPMVVRLPSGGGVGAGPFHSRNTEAWFAHVPGLKVVAPATAQDAYSLLRAAIDDPDPVLYYEQKYLYRREKGEVDPKLSVPLGAARRVCEGTTGTLVAYGNAVSLAAAAAEVVRSEGLSFEVLDLRSLVPWDWASVCASVRRTGRLVIVHEATRTGGFGAEVAAAVTERCFSALDAPIRRVAAADAPTPSHPALEAAFAPQCQTLVEVLRATAAY